MTAADCPTDLVVRARRGPLALAERARLDAHLAVCASCWLDQQVGSDFDAIRAPLPGDHARLALLADGVLSLRKSKRRGGARPGLVWFAAVAACALFAAAAGASVLLVRRAAEQATPMATQTAPDVPPPLGHRIATRATSENAAIAPEVPPPAEPQPRASRPSVAAGRIRGSQAAQVENAAALFENANKERRSNRSAAAISLYEDLVRRFPKSDEARIARVSMGRLLIDRAAWADGLAQLDAYLGMAPEGLLAPEALFGKARALSALGRRDDERRTWTRLLQKFPNSVYAAEAARQLALLGGVNP